MEHILGETGMDSDASREAIVDRLIALRPSEDLPPERIRRVVYLFQLGSPDIAALSVRLLSTGSLNAQDAARMLVTSALNVVNENDLQGSYGDDCSSFDAAYKHDLLLLWHVTEMADKTGTNDDVGWSEINAMSWNELIYQRDRADRSQDEDYWRGLAILGICAKCTEREDDKGNAIEFIRWSASRPDPEQVVLTSKEFNTIDTAALRSIMGQQDRTTAGLREGVL